MDEKYVLVTGASTGMGKATVELLDKKGYFVFAAVRSQKDMDLLRQSCSEKMTPIIMYVTKKEQIEAAFQIINKECGENGLYALMNNAGISVNAPLEHAIDEQINQQLAVNLYGLLHVTQTFTPLLRKFSAKNPSLKSRILNLGSIGSYQAMPLIGLYNISKFAVLAYSESLALELLSSNIEVCVIAPGSVKTAIWGKVEDPQDIYDKISNANISIYKPIIEAMFKKVAEFAQSGISSEKAAAKIVGVIEAKNPSFRTLIGIDAKILFFINRFVPARLRHKLLRSQVGY